jgi:uncharacterized protein involved in exopolysaccharide biosynthesis
MVRQPEPVWSPSALLQAALRRKAIIALTVVTVLGLAAAVTAISPRSYRSQAKVLVRLGRENVTLDPTATFGQAPVVAVPASRENDVNSVAELIKSREILEKVVVQVGPATILGDDSVDATSKAVVYKAVLHLARNLNVDVVKKTNVISVSYEAATPELAQSIVTRVVDVSLDQHLQLSRSAGAQGFLSEQAALLLKQLQKSEDNLRALKDKTGLASPEAQRQLLVTRIGRLEDDLQQTTSALAAATAELKAFQERLAAAPKMQVTGRTKGMPNGAADLMRSQLYALQIKELELKAKFPDTHPEIQLLRKQITAAEEILAKEDASRDQVTEGPGRVYEEAQVAVLKQEPAVVALKVRAETLRLQLAEERVALKVLNENVLAVSRLQRDTDLQEAQYRKYAENVEQARIDHALKQERISNLSLMQPATEELKPARPRPLINMGLGLVFAVLTSAGLVFALELREQSRKTPSTRRWPPSAADLAGLPEPAVNGHRS